MLLWKLFWTVSIVSFKLLPSTAYINCVNVPYSRKPTYQEIQECKNDNRYGYRHSCDNEKPDYQDNITCSAISLESSDTLYIQASKPKSIIFENSMIDIIPSRLFEKYSSLQQIYINDSYVTEIDLNAFNGLTNLEQLFLQSNEITEIVKGIFNSLIHLKSLDISNNLINTIEKKSFHGLTLLEVLNISRNGILNISEDMFDHNLHSLQILNLSHNFISEIDLAKILNLFSHDEQLSLQVDLSFNRLKAFNILQITINLDILNLSNNNLTTLDDLKNSITIKYLDLSNNRLSKFIYAPENIRYLNLSGNVIQNFNVSFSNSSKIEILDIGRNLIKSLNANIFDNMSSLTNLGLEGNQFVDLPIGLFKNLKHLEVLSLSGNRLKKFEFGIFTGLSNLLKLDISHNSFTNLDYKTFHSFRNLKVLNIANNELRTLNPYDIINNCKNLEMVIINNNPWYCESLLNFTMILTANGSNVQVMEGSNRNIKNHIGHACYDITRENTDKAFTQIDNNSIKKEVNDLTKFFELDFRNTSFYHFFENYKNHTTPSQANFETFNEYFNKDFKNTSFYKYFNKNISINFPTKDNESFRNLTSSLNMLNLKLSNLNQPNLLVGLPNSSQINFERFAQVLSNFSKSFDATFKSNNNFLNNNKTFSNILNESTIELLNGNLEKFSRSVNNITYFVEQESSFYKLLQTKFENGSSSQIYQNHPRTFSEALTSNMSYSKLIDGLDKNQDVAQQVASLRGSFIAFMTILIAVLLIAMMLPVLKKFACSFTRNPNENFSTCESTTDLPLVESGHVDSL